MLKTRKISKHPNFYRYDSKSGYYFLAILPVEQSEVIPAIWCFITLKSGLILLYYSKHYQTSDRESESLVTEENVTENNP